MLQTLLVHHQKHEHLQEINKLLNLSLYNSICYTYLHQDFPAALLHAKDQYIKQSFHSITVL